MEIRCPGDGVIYPTGGWPPAPTVHKKPAGAGYIYSAHRVLAQHGHNDVLSLATAVFAEAPGGEEAISSH